MTPLPIGFGIERSRRQGGRACRFRVQGKPGEPCRSRVSSQQLGLREMGGRSNVFGLQLHKALWVVLILQLQADGCTSLNIEGWALLKFRSRVEVDPHGAFRNWDAKDKDPCNWSGIHCIDGKVESLNLKNLSLGGILAPELGKLSHLRSLVLYKNNFSGAIPKEIAGLTMLELLDLRGNSLSGAIPKEIGEMLSLKNLLLCDNVFQGSTPQIEKLNLLSEQKCDGNLSFDVDSEIICINRKVGCCIWQSDLQQMKKTNPFMIPVKGNLLQFLDMLPLFKLKRDSSSHGHGETNIVNMQSFTKPYAVQNINAVNSFRRKLLQETSNLPAAPVSGLSLQEAVAVPSTGSGSFPAVPNSNNGNGKEHSSAAIPNPLPNITGAPGNGKEHSSAAVPNPLPGITGAPHQSSKPTNTMDNGPASNERLGKWVYVLILPGFGLLLAIIASMLACRRKGVAAIGPWKTGLSGQLQKAFIAGVPKLNRSELEAACEDFSNIVITFPECTIFKGTLSSGVEIAVVSTCISSAKDWSRRSEMRFRKMIDTMSRVNHKNYVNLLGYCEENEPFMRMMVFEYAPNGSLFEHLHVKEFEHLDWCARMRIIMGTAYCLQYMHHELSPPVTLTDVQSGAIFMTDDYAAKIVDTSIWKEVAKRRISGDDDKDPSEPPLVEPGSNVYSFGILMLEVISGKLPYSERQGCLLNWATEYLSDTRNIRHLVDPMLKSLKHKELEIIVEVIQECIHHDPKNRPTMKEVTAKLREVIAISPEAATPRLSPLWWAELEILSVEAS